MHNPGSTNGNQSGLTQEQDLEAPYSEDFMNIDNNLFGLDSEGRDLIFGMSNSNNSSDQAKYNNCIGRSNMNDNNTQNQQYEPTPMQTDNNDLNNILAQMPTPVSNNIHASSDTNSFMSPLQVDRQSYDRLNGARYPHRGNDEVCYKRSIAQLLIFHLDVLHSAPLSRCDANGCPAST